MAARKGNGSEEPAQRRIQSIEVGFQVIRAMEAANGPLPLRDIAAAAGMPASKVHLYLVSFVKEKVAYQDAVTGHYGLGPFAIQLGLSAIRQLDVVELARDELSALRGVTGFATYLSLWGDRGPGIVSKMDGERQGSLAVRLGYVLPTLTSATGQVFLSYLDESQTAALRQDEIAGQSATTTARGIAETIETVRAQGFAMTTNSINANFAAVSAPVFDYSGRIAAALTVLGSDKQLTGPRRKATISALLDSTRRLSARLGAIDPDRKDAAPSAAPEKMRVPKGARART
ncbi:MAG TPA: IclR family transcriptional regulator [Rhizobiaceae bacterium]|nr:IclR family transcriptional regulator [Rhizobiaceae bacterium]